MKHTFSILLTMCILMLIGAALIPGLDVADKPRPRQGSTLSIQYSWPGASAKVVEQNVTSRIEGMVSAVGGVESVSSTSRFGSGSVTVRLKKEANVSATKFEIAALLRQVRDRLPEGVSWPTLSGGDVVTSSNAPERDRPLLTWQINADMPDIEIRRRTEEELKPILEHIEGISSINVSGGSNFYLEISYDAVQLAYNSLTANDISNAISDYIGYERIVGDVMHDDSDGSQSRITLKVKMDSERLSLEELPIKTVDGKIVYLNNLAKCQWREEKPTSYYRVNGMNTVYLSVNAEEDANINRLADKVKRTVEEWEASQDEATTKHPLHFKLNYDKAEEQFSAFKTTIRRSGLSLLILLLFVWLSRRNGRYLFIIAITLAANLLLGVIAYRLFDLRLHPVSMAGMAVSLGLIIDSTIVMVDHYSYHRDRGAFGGILGAMLTTIGSMVIIFWMPESLRNQLFDFTWIVIINLTVALIVAFFYVPALTERMHYVGRLQGKPRHLKLLLWWNRLYGRYIQGATHRIGRWVLLTLFVGLFAWSLNLFIDALKNNRNPPKEQEMQLHIRGQMPLGGTAYQLNEKVQEVEAFLSQYQEIRRYETQISGRNAYINVFFKPEALQTSFPYMLENHVIGKVISIGGADWSTWGVNPRGFSNSLNLQHRSNSIEIAGYDYDKLYRFAEDIEKYLKSRGRVTDIIIEIPGQWEQEDEFYMEYDREKLVMDSLMVRDIYNTMSSMLYTQRMSQRKTHRAADILLMPLQNDSLDLWQLRNSFLRVGGRDVRLSDFMNIQQRKAKNTIPRENQEYRLRVAFNILGSWQYSDKLMKTTRETFYAKFPIGFRCVDNSYYWRQEEGQQYWLLGLVVAIIFFVCAILFESLYQSLIIILLIPFSLIGTFLTYHWSAVEFGTGGFAAMVLLCGLTVNAGIYLMNEYNRNGRNYLRAYNHKIIPILLTVLSTICGLLPFLLDGPEENFWFSFAVGSISGLLFSVLVLILAIPLFLKKRKKKR